ncbi:M4 family metallopeptidase [Nocardioides sp.]|uniref:M4 family metallopeptidase n=1 Tax=Nocardioides sp. TaxID=35761 RepID=UPI001A25FC55|nr:M4 family metallopeptidase [Nocardioides sp.]MBJ7357991.1 M4 family metallopeptidase [Nocardioides sp.]
MSPSARLLPALTATALAVATLSVTAAGGAQGVGADNQGVAVDRLQDDASATVTIVRSTAGDVTFVGTPAGQRVDNPAVTPATSVRAAAAAHVARYGPALGTGRKGTTLREHRVLATDAGHTVRFRQEVDGLPVLGGDVVVSLGKDRELASLLSTMSTATEVQAARVSVDAAATTARLVAGRGRAAVVTSSGRWLLDPAVIGMSSRDGARGVWRFTVDAGLDLDREVFVDDQTGAPLLSFDNHHQANRIVCDNANVQLNPNSPDVPCTTPVRSEGDAPTGIADVDDVYTFVGATSDLYQSIGVDLTDMIGKDVGGTKKISSTVRICYSGTCPYANAFWNGTEMYYGTGLTVDDVTGHELTHGVTDRTSELLYWGQSGAINESISDIMGEIVDHRTPTTGDSATDWRLAEDSSIGSIRDLADPTAEGHPDRTQSALYVDDLGDGEFYGDNGGVHSNSGVSNKTAYLIMEGGTFNGQTVTGIDGGDTFPKTARLYQLVNESMSSGADFADLGLVLVQACNSLVGTHGFTAADCTEVQKAALATELSQTPANSPQPADADTTCPVGQVKTTIFDSETGSPATKFTSTAANWGYGEDPVWGSNAHSGQSSWHNATPISGAATPAVAERLVMAAPIAVPVSGNTYLSFHGWYFLDFTISQPSGTVVDRRDGATVEVDDVDDGAGPVDVAAQPWVNGPSTVINSASNPANGRTAFTADSRGWVGSRLDLASFKGKRVKPQFSVNYNSSFTYVGWFLDDITVYHCGVAAPPVVNAGPDSTVTAGTAFSSPGSFTDEVPAVATATVDYGDGSGPQALPLTGSSFTLNHTYATPGVRTVTVTVTDGGALTGTDTATVTVNPAPPPVFAVTPGTVTVKGALLVGKKLKATVTGWQPDGVTYTYQWLRNGKAIKKATGKKYLLTMKDTGKKLQVRVTATKAGHTPATVTSKKTKKVEE